MMWNLEYLRKVGNSDSNPVIENIVKTYTINDKNQLKDYVSNIFSVKLDKDKNPIEPTMDQIKFYNLYNNDPSKIDGVLKFFKKNYERYLDIIKETNDFEKEDYKYDIIDQADIFYLDRCYTSYNKEIFKESYISIKKINEEV